MSYVTNSDIESWMGTDAYIELTDDTGAGSANTTRVNEARLGAEGEANSYLATRYKVPVNVGAESEVQAVLRAFILDLVSYRLHSRRPPVPADIIRRREEAVTWFSRVASGIVQLPSAALVPSNTALGDLAVVSQASRIMTRESIEDL